MRLVSWETSSLCLQTALNCIRCCLSVSCRTFLLRSFAEFAFLKYKYKQVFYEEIKNFQKKINFAMCSKFILKIYLLNNRAAEAFSDDSVTYAILYHIFLSLLWMFKFNTNEAICKETFVHELQLTKLS